MFLITAIPGVQAGENDPFLSDSELSFIKEHPVIHLGVDPKFVPFEFLDEKGK